MKYILGKLNACNRQKNHSILLVINKCKFGRQVGIIGGSGLDDPEILDGRKEIYLETPYGMCDKWWYDTDTIFHLCIYSFRFDQKGAISDVLINGRINGIDCVLLARHGRKHSIMPSTVNYRANVWALKNVGCTHLIVTTATGSLQEHIKPGDIVILDNFIDRTTKRNQTFYDGKELSPFGVCHLPMEPAFCEKSRDVIIQTACDLGLYNMQIQIYPIPVTNWFIHKNCVL